MARLSSRYGAVIPLAASILLGCSTQISRDGPLATKQVNASPNDARTASFECPTDLQQRLHSLDAETIFGAAWPRQPEPSAAGSYQVMQPLNTPKTDYPIGQILSRNEGRVLVLLLVDKSGRVEDARVACSDSEKFHEAALSAARAARFEPSHVDAQPIKDVGLQPFDFRIEKD
jgi:TonB family protein